MYGGVEEEVGSLIGRQPLLRRRVRFRIDLQRHVRWQDQPLEDGTRLCRWLMHGRQVHWRPAGIE